MELVDQMDSKAERVPVQIWLCLWTQAYVALAEVE